ncbi:MAG: LytR/AlgR family response regulator transcription factor [Candidatus Onthomonas sp.]
MYTIAVCDDEAAFASYLSTVIQERFQRRHIPVTVDSYLDPEELLKRLGGSICYDILLMDIDMPELNGIELCRQFRQAGGDSLVVFVSNKEELVFQTFDVQPFRLVRKSRFQEEIDKLCQDLIQELERRSDKWLRFSDESDGTVYSVNIRRLVYVEARGKYCRLCSVEKAEEVKIRFQDICRQLEPDSFIQVHRSYLVNPYYIYRIDLDTVLLDQGETVPLSRRRRNQIKEEYFRWSRCEG